MSQRVCQWFAVLGVALSATLSMPSVYSGTSVVGGSGEGIDKCDTRVLKTKPCGGESCEGTWEKCLGCPGDNLVVYFKEYICETGSEVCGEPGCTARNQHKITNDNCITQECPLKGVKNELPPVEELP